MKVTEGCFRSVKQFLETVIFIYVVRDAFKKVIDWESVTQVNPVEEVLKVCWGELCFTN